MKIKFIPLNIHLKKPNLLEFDPPELPIDDWHVFPKELWQHDCNH